MSKNKYKNYELCKKCKYFKYYVPHYNFLHKKEYVYKDCSHENCFVRKVVSKENIQISLNMKKTYKIRILNYNSISMNGNNNCKYFKKSGLLDNLKKYINRILSI